MITKEFIAVNEWNEEICGELIKDYVNAPKIEDAWIILVENIQMLFMFSSKFTSQKKQEINQLAETRIKAKQWTVLRKMQNILRTALSNVIAGRPYYKDEGFRKMFNRGCSWHRKLYMDENGSIKQKYPVEKSHQWSVTRNKNIPSYARVLSEALANLFLTPRSIKRIQQCVYCKQFFLKTRLNSQKFCSDKCRLTWHNRRRIESGKAREYKRKKRAEGAKESYYG